MRLGLARALRASLWLFALVLVEACASLGAQGGDSALRVQWCPDTKEAKVEVEFGPEGTEPASTRPWEGGYSYTLTGPRGGVGGGRGVSHPSVPDRLSERRWRLSLSEVTEGVPTQFVYRVGAPMPPEDAPRVGYTLSAPDTLPAKGCVPLSAKASPLPAELSE